MDEKTSPINGFLPLETATGKRFNRDVRGVLGKITGWVMGLFYRCPSLAEVLFLS
jgi:hypothetical protein